MAKKKQATKRPDLTGQSIKAIVAAADVLREAANKMPDSWQKDDLLILEKSLRSQSIFVLDAAALLDKRQARVQ